MSGAVACMAILGALVVLGPLPWALILTVLGAVLVIVLAGAAALDEENRSPVEHHHCRVLRAPVDWEEEGWL